MDPDLQRPRTCTQTCREMCSRLCCCLLPFRSGPSEDSSNLAMRTETDGFRLNLFNFRRTPRVQAAGANAAATDGPPSPTKEEKPPNVVLSYDQILEAKRLCEAGRLLIEREERLFGGMKESEPLARHEEEVSVLAADRVALEALVLQTLSLSLGPEEAGTQAALASAVTAMDQEEDQDRRWTQSGRTPPAWRPSGWKQLHDSTLRGLVEERMDNPPTPTASQPGQSSIQADVLAMGRQLKEDLLHVVRAVKSCYPAHMNICNVYARLYHLTFSARLRKIADFGLEDKDCSFLLQWVNEYYPQVLQKQELAGEIVVDALGKLLPEELLEPLECQYLSKQREELTTFIYRVLDEEKLSWCRGEEPTRENGCFSSPVSYDIIQLINGMVTSAERVVGDLHKAQSITSQLEDIMQNFKIFQNDIMKHNKPNSRPAMKANLGCIEQFRDVLQKKRHLFRQEVQENCLQVLAVMKQSAHVYLLKPVHEVLKPHYRKLGTSDWLNKPLFEKLLASIEKELQDLQGSIESCHQELVGQLHQEVTAEYVSRLLRGRVKLKDKDQQLKAYDTVKDNAESLHDLFLKMGSQEVHLKDILTKIAEVLKLQDLPAIQMQVASLGADYPDLSEKHVLALLKLKTNLSKADRKTIKGVLSDTRAGQSGDAVRPFFSGVLIRDLFPIHL